MDDNQIETILQDLLEKGLLWEILTNQKN
jgi:hypothetical protein